MTIRQNAASRITMVTWPSCQCQCQCQKHL